VSHDGNVPEVVDYVNSLKDEFNLIQLFHPYSCFEHKTTFPGDDPSLNRNYAGDSFGHPRSAWVTCCKHHFTWLMNVVFNLKFEGSSSVNHFLFMEEDYVVAPTVYVTVASGLYLLDRYKGEAEGGFFGLILDPTEAGHHHEATWLDQETWFAHAFHSGPMTMSRYVFGKIQKYAKEYCTFDDYNWDWTMVGLQNKKIIPHLVLVPSRVQTRHIGLDQGMHTTDRKGTKHLSSKQKERLATLDTKFGGTKLSGRLDFPPDKHLKGFGGWGHPADHQHCQRVLSSTELYVPSNFSQPARVSSSSSSSNSWSQLFHLEE
jgi:alpha-1,6-mannosyl-glycoprotein beta-1,2-N-acetylglucosaminyltransferase